MNTHDDTALTPRGPRPTKRSLPALLAALTLPLALAAAGGTEAASVALDPSATVVNPNGTFTVAIRLSATDAPGTHPGSYCGDIVVDYDPALLSYSQFSFAAGITGMGGPTIGTSGNLKTITLGFDQAHDASTIGTFTFNVLNKPGSTATLHLADADSFFGTFITHLPTNQPFYPTLVGTAVSITAVPVPAGAGLLFSALATLGATLRRRRDAP